MRLGLGPLLWLRSRSRLRLRLRSLLLDLRPLLWLRRRPRLLLRLRLWSLLLLDLRPLLRLRRRPRLLLWLRSLLLLDWRRTCRRRVGPLLLCWRRSRLGVGSRADIVIVVSLHWSRTIRRDRISAEVIYIGGRTCNGGMCGNTVVGLEEVGLVLLGHAFMGSLYAHRTHAALVESGLLLLAGTHIHAALAAVIADAVVDSYIIDDGLVDVYIANHCRIYAGNSAVIEEVVTLPVSAFVATAKVAIPVIHAAVETNVGAPVSCVPEVSAAAPAPIPRGPQ